MWRGPLGGYHLESGVPNQRRRDGLVEDVMVYRAELQIPAHTVLEARAAAGVRISREIVKRKHLRKMSLIGFACASLEVVHQVGQRRDRPAMIERPSSFGQHEQQTSARDKHAAPFVQRAKRVGDVFERVRGEYEVITRLRNVRKM